MRNSLLYGTALVAATMLASGGALAADKKMMKPSVAVGGYFEAIIGGIVDETQETNGADSATDTTALDVRSDSEIHFKGSGTLDNGVKIAARVELEGQQGGGGEQTDEYWLSVSGSFGQIVLGGTGGAPVRMLTGLSGSWATGVGETLNFDNAWVPSAAGNHYGLQHSRLDTGDANKMTYISPKLGGFQVGATYSPNRVNDDNGKRYNTDDGPHDGIEIAASWGGTFGNVGFGVGAGMTSYQGAGAKTDDDRRDWLVAARLDFGGGFRVAVAHKQVDDENEMNESQLTDVGARFVQGANSFSLVGSHGEMKNTDAFHTAVMGSYARAMGPGVKAHLNAIWNRTESGDGSKENEGTALVTGIKVSF